MNDMNKIKRENMRIENMNERKKRNKTRQKVHIKLHSPTDQTMYVLYGCMAASTTTAALHSSDYE